LSQLNQLQLGERMGGKLKRDHQADLSPFYTWARTVPHCIAADRVQNERKPYSPSLPPHLMLMPTIQPCSLPPHTPSLSTSVRTPPHSSKLSYRDFDSVPHPRLPLVVTILPLASLLTRLVGCRSYVEDCGREEPHVSRGAYMHAVLHNNFANRYREVGDKRCLAIQILYSHIAPVFDSSTAS
jgi:hypothetical protein